MDHSWYHLWKGQFSILTIYKVFIACYADCMGMKYEVVFECCEEVSPGAIVDKGLFLCRVLVIACPFSCWGAYFEVCKGGGHMSGVVRVKAFI